MLKILRLTRTNRRYFSLFQFNKLLKANESSHSHTKQTKVFNSKMSSTETNGESASATSTTQNLDGIVKFLELVGNLKVSFFIDLIFDLTF